MYYVVIKRLLQTVGLPYSNFPWQLTY